MRDPARIGEILDVLETYWRMFPDLRLGQIIANSLPDDLDVFFAEDEKVLLGLFGMMLFAANKETRDLAPPDTRCRTLPRVGEIVWTRGGDDYRGGWGTISEVERGVSGGQPAIFVSFEELPGLSCNWEFLELEQERLRDRHGLRRTKRIGW